MSTPKFTQIMLQYPLRFEWAVKKYTESPIALANEQKLVFYALQMQAETGACNTPKPSYFDAINRAKWEAWSHLGKMSKIEAMRFFVREMDESDPSWLEWSGFDAMKTELIESFMADSSKKPSSPLPSKPPEPALSEEKEPDTPTNSESAPQSVAPEPSLSQTDNESVPDTPNLVEEPLVEGTAEQSDIGRYEINVVSYKEVHWDWELVAPKGLVPTARYRQAGCAFQSCMYIFGGIGGSGGRFFSDLCVFDAESEQWVSTPISTGDCPSQRSSSSMVSSDTHIYLFGGQYYNSFLNDFYQFDTESNKWRRIATKQDLKARGGHSLVFWNKKVIIFGGETKGQTYLGDVWVFDEETETWEQKKCNGVAPSVRRDHSACVIGDQMIVFGGINVMQVLGDVPILDLKTWTWISSKCWGPKPSPRAGHGAAVLQNKMYICGGGDGGRGFEETYTLDTECMEWRVITGDETNLKAREGLTLCGVLGCIYAFGGYNSKYTNNTYRLEIGRVYKTIATQTDPAGYEWKIADLHSQIYELQQQLNLEKQRSVQIEGMLENTRAALSQTRSMSSMQSTPRSLDLSHYTPDAHAQSWARPGIFSWDTWTGILSYVGLARHDVPSPGKQPSEDV